MNRKPIPYRSKRMANLYATERRNLVKELLRDFPACQRCAVAYATDVHEIKTRARGGSITDRENLALLCRQCHTFITQNPTQGKSEGWLKNSWDD
jgi:5-methylcytosine-specific restriction endonuclease McrA